MAPTSGILYVTMQPKPELEEAKFHDWYQNEHGPTRLRLPFITNGFRYRAADLSDTPASKEKPEWMAVYDITDMNELTKDDYMRLRAQPVKSKREADAMAQIYVDRKLFDFIESKESPKFKALEKVENEGKGNVIVAVFIDIRNEEGMRERLDRWYREEHVDLLAKVPGWLRTRRFVTSSIDPTAPVEYLALHEYAPQNGLGGLEFKVATSTPWNREVMTNVVTEKRRRVYDLCYTFGPAPRYLTPHIAEWQSSDTKFSFTKTSPTSPGGAGAIESFITTKDGVELPFCLEGSPDPDAPLLVLSNSILVDYHIWDGFVSAFFSSPQNKKYRIVRYLTRGRSSSCGAQIVTVDVLALDIITILDALRVKKAAAVIGVSLGGCTVLNAALKYPTRVESFISCDTSSKSPAGNSKAWGERVALCEKEGAKAESGESIVGDGLADITVKRWFVKENLESPEFARIKAMVKNNSLEGFRKSVNALFEYDLEEEMKSSKVKALFVVGSGDGVLPGTMKEMSNAYGEGAGYTVIEGAGHLPMVEKPEAFAVAVENFLSS